MTNETCYCRVAQNLLLWCPTNNFPLNSPEFIWVFIVFLNTVVFTHNPEKRHVKEIKSKS
uniref:Uncharacterized protein n=1 Tax=Lotus japonicus TaxID=34305 RepID=I3SVL2_LOTJA|nr:unknown [Lotus japonicus]